MWWEIRKLVVVVIVVDAVVAVVCLAVCAGLGAMHPEGMGTALFIAAVVLAFVGAGAGNGAIRATQIMPGRGSGMNFPFALEMEAEDRNRHRFYDMEQLRSVSPAIALGVAAVPLVVASVLLIA